MELDIKYRTAQDIYAVCGPVLIRIADGANTELGDIDRIHAWFTEMLAHQPNIGMLLVAHHGNPPPSMATIRYAVQQMGHMQERIVVGVALLGLGFWADTARAVTAGLMRLLRGGAVILASSPEAAIEGMVLELVGLDGAALLAATAELERLRR